jgi:hypothetical protein
MRKFQFFLRLGFVLTLTFGVSYLAIADCADGLGEDKLLNELRPKAPWVTTWWMLDGPITNNGGFAVSACIDWLDEHTGGKITDESVTTPEGLEKTLDIEVKMDKKNGGTRKWTAIEIDPADTHNMSTIYDEVNLDNISTYAIIVIEADKDLNSVIATTHDDHAQVWLNGDQIYSNKEWTGNVLEVDYEQKVKLNKGANILLFRCGESGGDDYFNLHFDDATNKSIKTYPQKEDDKQFRSDVQRVLAVDARGKLATQWADIKRRQ